MEDRFNTIAGWTLFSGIIALGLTSLSGHYFRADKPHRPHEMGYPIAGVVEASVGGTAEVPIETLLASADVAKGEATFKKCASCHTVASGGANGIGPNLFGVVGEPIGKGRASYAFSPDLAGHGGNWDWANLNTWLTNPKRFASGTKMSFAGISDGQERANVMAYLNTQGSNLPMPAAPAAAPAVEGAPSPAADGPAAAGATAAAAPAPEKK